MAKTLREYWNDLDLALKEFDATNTILPKNADDERVYRLQRHFLITSLELGLAIEDASGLKKIPKSLKLQSLAETTFGKEKIITIFHGPLSVTFAQLVYLPHGRRFGEVTLEDQSAFLQRMADLPKHKAETHALMDKLDRAIMHYHRSEHSADLTRLSLFSHPHLRSHEPPSHTSASASASASGSYK